MTQPDIVSFYKRKTPPGFSQLPIKFQSCSDLSFEEAEDSAWLNLAVRKQPLNLFTSVSGGYRHLGMWEHQTGGVFVP